MRLIDADALIRDLQERYCRPCKASGLDYNRVKCKSCQFDDEIDDIDGFADNCIEPNLILPERMERGDIYEVGETIVVLNHDDYYDLLCKSWMPKRGEWRYVGNSIELVWECPQCGYKVFGFERELPNFCGNCGCDMRKESE